MIRLTGGYARGPGADQLKLPACLECCFKPWPGMDMCLISLKGAQLEGRRALEVWGGEEAPQFTYGIAARRQQSGHAISLFYPVICT